MGEVIVTLSEKRYHYGVAALINSLVKAGFKGLFVVGYKGELPFWLNQLKRQESEYIINEYFTLKFVLLDVPMHFGYYKPFLLKEVLGYPLTETAYYFDPDIVVVAPWQFISSWSNSGAVALCMDNAFPFVHRNHPWRKEWKKLAKDAGVDGEENDINFYINSGFIGVNKYQAELLDRWISLTHQYSKEGGNIQMFEKDGHRAYKGDQDLLNAAMTVSADINMSIIGTEGMGFAYPHYLMLHAVESTKPWDNNFIKETVLRGKRPTGAAKGFVNNCSYPIQVYSPFKLQLKKLNVKIASALSRIIS
jgi:hypothetical protein